LVLIALVLNINNEACVGFKIRFNCQGKAIYLTAAVSFPEEKGIIVCSFDVFYGDITLSNFSPWKIWSFKFSLFASNLLGIVCWIIYLAETDVKMCTMMMIVLMMSNRYNTQRSQTQSK